MHVMYPSSSASLTNSHRTECSTSIIIIIIITTTTTTIKGHYNTTING
jgi:hypothetical protein